jgi:hypothetical protein
MAANPRCGYIPHCSSRPSETCQELEQQQQQEEAARRAAEEVGLGLALAVSAAL